MMNRGSLVAFAFVSAFVAAVGCHCHKESVPPLNPPFDGCPGAALGFSYEPCLGPGDADNCTQAKFNAFATAAGLRTGCFAPGTTCQKAPSLPQYACRANLRAGAVCYEGQTVVCSHADPPVIGHATCGSDCAWGDCS